MIGRPMGRSGGLAGQSPMCERDPGSSPFLIRAFLFAGLRCLDAPNSGSIPALDLTIFLWARLYYGTATCGQYFAWCDSSVLGSCNARFAQVLVKTAAGILFGAVKLRPASQSTF